MQAEDLSPGGVMLAHGLDRMLGVQGFVPGLVDPVAGPQGRSGHPGSVPHPLAVMPIGPKPMALDGGGREEFFPGPILLEETPKNMCYMIGNNVASDLSLNLNFSAELRHLSTQELAKVSNTDRNSGATHDDYVKIKKSPKAAQIPRSVVKKQLTKAIETKQGGWPKGRKRKAESLLKPPKAPATGYVLYLNEKRKLYKNIPFADVTKLLGNEWSRMSQEEKQIYLDQAEEEKKRYQKEFSLFKQSDAYQCYLMEQRLNRDNKETENLNIPDEADLELYCRACDQWFNSLHNKREHLLGRQHLQNITGHAKRFPPKTNRSATVSCSFPDENQLPTVNSTTGISMETWTGRERDHSGLRQKISTLMAERVKHLQDIAELSEKKMRAKAAWQAEQQRKIELESQICSLLAVPFLLRNLFPASTTQVLDENANIYTINNLHNAQDIAEDLDMIVDVEQV